MGTLTYTYDLAGRRTEVGGTWARTGLPAIVMSGTYDAANRLTQWAGNLFSYDPNGNLASDGLSGYMWNARNELVGLSGGTSASFAYDAFGRRRTKTIGGTTTNFLYDARNFVQELTSGGTPTANLLTGLGMDETFTRTDAGGTRTLLTDVLDSVLEIVDSSGTLQTHYTFEPFGATTTSGASSTNAAQFTGRENDGTGLYSYRNRYYDPEVGRFASEDPIGFEAGVNFYAYVQNNPLGFIDPEGLQRTFPIKVPPPPAEPWVDVPGFWRDFYQGANDMYRNYRNMRDAKIPGSDKWFHCMANCQASQRGPGGLLAAQIISDLREDYGYWKGDPLGDSLDDMRANRCGRRGDPKCENRCKQYLPPGWNPAR
jgi:RHS repeat-associated protein